MKFKSILAASLAATVLFASCSKEDSGNPVAAGEPTYMTVSFTQPNTMTRATGDANATAVEADVKTVDVYIYEGTTQVRHAALTASDFMQGTSTATADVWTSTTQIATTTGAKTIFLGVNLPSATATALESAVLGDFAAVAQTMTMGDLVKTDRIAMFCTAAATPTLVKTTDPGYATANKITMSVKRMVAKVTVEEHASIAIVATGGTVGALEFAVNNLNKKMFMLPAADGKDPNYTSAQYSAADFVQAVNTPGVSGDEYVAVNAAGTAVLSLNAKYAAENTSALHIKQESTYATVRSTFKPTKVWEETSTNVWTEETNLSATPVSFWSVKHAGYDYYTLSAADAAGLKTQLETASGGTAVISAEYVDGYCYWTMWLNPQGKFNGVVTSGKEYDVFRNDFYRCTVKKILAPGNPIVTPQPPTDPIATSTDIDVEIDILYWNSVSDEYELNPNA